MNDIAGQSVFNGIMRYLLLSLIVAVHSASCGYPYQFCRTLKQTLHIFACKLFADHLRKNRGEMPVSVSGVAQWTVLCSDP